MIVALGGVGYNRYVSSTAVPAVEVCNAEGRRPGHDRAERPQEEEDEEERQKSDRLMRERERKLFVVGRTRRKGARTEGRSCGLRW